MLALANALVPTWQLGYLGARVADPRTIQEEENQVGRLDLDSGPVNLRTLLDFADAARRVGADFDVERWLVRSYVAGVEVTQAIQYYRAAQHLTNADDRGSDPTPTIVGPTTPSGWWHASRRGSASTCAAGSSA
jgi:hypothetical protein